MSDEVNKDSGLLAGVARMFRPDPDKPAAPPPSCCGECGGEAKKTEQKQPIHPEQQP